MTHFQNDDNSQESQQPVMSIDMPVLETMEDNSGQNQELKLEDDNNQQMVGVPVSMPSLDDEVEAQNAHANSEAVDDGQIKFILNDGQLLQYNNHILTDSEGNSILVQGTDSEQIQQLLQSVGVLQGGEGLDGEALHMLDENNQIMIVQQDGSGEAQLIDASMINADGQIVIQQAHDDDNSQSTDGIPVQYATQDNNMELHQHMQDDGSQELQTEQHDDSNTMKSEIQSQEEMDTIVQGSEEISQHEEEFDSSSQAITSEATSTTQVLLHSL